MTVIDRKIAPDFKQVSSIKFIDPKTYNLDNNILVHFIAGGSQDILKIDFIFDAGINKQKKPLIAKATNSLLKEGTKKYNAFEIAEGIDQYGAYFQNEVEYNKASLTIYTLSKHLEKVLNYVEEIILNPTFSNEEFEIYKENALERFKINQEKVSFVARNEFMKQVFGSKNCYGKIATSEDFKNLNLDDIKNFYNENYSLENCEIIVSGKADENTLKSLNTFFGNVNLKDISSKEKTETIELSNFNSKKYIEKDKALQSAIRIGKIMPNKLHPDYFKLQILSTVLGGYFGSRLMKNIREDKGFTYGIGCGLLSLKETGYFYISTEVGAKVTKNALDEIYKEIKLIQSVEIENEELELVKNYLLGNLLKSCDGPFKMAALYENVHFYGLDYSFYNNYIKTIKEVTAKELLLIAQSYFAIDTLTEIVVGKID